MIGRGTLAKYVRPGDIFVETGTRDGDTVAVALELGAREVWTVENQEPLWKACLERFGRDPRVKLHLGDSAEVLEKTILPGIDGRPAVFWIDAHTSGKRSPILEELQALSRRPVPGRTLLMDDVRCYRRRDWGVSLGEVVDAILRVDPGFTLWTEHGYEPHDVLIAGKL